MKKIKQKVFFIKAAMLYILLVGFISLVSLFLWENKFYDMLLLSSSANPSNYSDISVILIDDKSVEAHRWPWERSLYGEIFSFLNTRTQAKAVIFDSVLNTLDENHPDSDQKFFNTVKDIPNLISGFMFRKDNYEDELSGIKYNVDFKQKFSINVIDKRTSKYKYTSDFNSMGMFPEEYFNALKNVGSVNINSDNDGVLRSAYDLIYYDGAFYPTLALRTYMYINNIKNITIDDNYIYADKTGLKIPVFYSNGNVKHYIYFNKFLPGSEYSYKTYSAIDIINSERAIREGHKPLINPNEFKGKTVFLGANVRADAMGLTDVLETPISIRHPGVDIQAVITENYINKKFITKTSAKTNILTIIILSLISFIILRYFSFIVSILLLLIIFVIYFTVCIFLYKNNIAPLVITPIAAQISTMIFGYSYRFILEGMNKEKIKQAMGKYLSQDIMKNVVKNIDDIRLGGKKANVTVLFADIRGFTSMSEKMTAEEVSLILNEYFSELEPIITKYNGVINKFIGDAVMAIFGEPVQDINHASNAVKCAYEMLKKVEWLRNKWLNEGKPKIEIGIGINTGEAFVGNIGSEKRLEYTVIGDTVNLASRIESYNKVYKTNFLISSSTYSYVSEITDVIKIADVQIRGKAKKMDIYEVLRLS